MARKQPYAISYDQATKKQLRAIDKKHHSVIRAEIEEQLQLEPGKETRNRKPLRQPAPFEARWEIRFGPAKCPSHFRRKATRSAKGHVAHPSQIRGTGTRRVRIWSCHDWPFRLL